MADVDDHLARIELARQAQLDALPTDPTSIIAEAHRGTVRRIIDQARAARERVRAGTFGLCVRCRACYFMIVPAVP